MKLISLAITFILSFQLVYANATVCENYGECGQSVTSEMDQMKDCPFHSNQKTEDKKEETTKTQCKCCAVLTLETTLQPKPTFTSVLSFIEFQYKENSFQTTSSLFLRPPIV